MQSKLRHLVKQDARGQALSLTYGRFFAEFLEDLSPVRLGLLDLPTCVGLRYGSRTLMLRSFSWKDALSNSLWRTAGSSLKLKNAQLRACYRIFLIALLDARTHIRSHA